MFGVNVVELDLINFIGAIGTIVSFGLMIWNQISRHDVKSFFWKRY